MKKLHFSFLLVFLSFFSCKDEIDPIMACGVADPVKNLDWLAILADEIDETYNGVYYYISQTELDGQDVFVLQNCCPTCNSIPVVYACDGEPLGCISANAGINPAILDDATVIWRSTGFVCSK